MLLFVALNPPLTSGTRTRARGELARTLLGFELVEYGNLFAHATRDLAGIATVGVSEDGWTAARSELTPQIRRAQGALLGYGVQSPSGTAGRLFKKQVEWLEAELTHLAVPVWVVGGQPRHPSRWQRHTHRAHFGTPFELALSAALRRRDAPPADAQ